MNSDNFLSYTVQTSSSVPASQVKTWHPSVAILSLSESGFYLQNPQLFITLAFQGDSFTFCCIMSLSEVCHLWTGHSPLFLIFSILNCHWFLPFFKKKNLGATLWSLLSWMRPSFWKRIFVPVFWDPSTPKPTWGSLFLWLFSNFHRDTDWQFGVCSLCASSSSFSGMETLSFW